MDLRQTMSALAKLGNAQTRKTWLSHGATGEFFGVRIGDMKTLLKKLKGRQELALELYASGNLDAMYLAGLVADGARMSRKELETWARDARWGMLSEYTVPWVAAESSLAPDLARKWIESKKEHVAASGWNTWSVIVATRPDSELDLDELAGLLARVERDIGRAQNRVRYCMNGFVIAAGSAVKPLFARAKATAKKIGKVEVNMGETACRVPDALEVLGNIQEMGRVGKKRASMKC